MLFKQKSESKKTQALKNAIKNEQEKSKTQENTRKERKTFHIETFF